LAFNAWFNAIFEFDLGWKISSFALSLRAAEVAGRSQIQSGKNEEASPAGIR
jgi:hypothetical protein